MPPKMILIADNNKKKIKWCKSLCKNDTHTPCHTYLFAFPAMASIASPEMAGNRISLACNPHASTPHEKKGAPVILTPNRPRLVVFEERLAMKYHPSVSGIINLNSTHIPKLEMHPGPRAGLTHEWGVHSRLGHCPTVLLMWIKDQSF